MLPVVARPEVADDLAQLSPALLRALRRLLPRLRADPLRSSQPLDYDPRIGSLGDCRKVYFDESDPQRIQIVSIGPRANLEAYRRAAARLERG